MKFLRYNLAALALVVATACAETLTPLVEVPQTADALWADYDPRAEPLDVEILKEWEEEGVVMQVLRYRVGVFKGQKAMLAAVYGYPKGASNLPGLVQIHGGGQYADYKAVLTNAKRGYATLSIAWAGRLNAPEYFVNSDIVQLFFDGKTDDPRYKVTTDWGALEGYHAPSRYKSNNVIDLMPAEWTYDAVESPRNSTWYLWTMGARRGLTFLEQQPQVDPERLGVYGHSMGGKLTVMTAGSDDRVKAAAPSCGGVSDRTRTPLHNATIGDAPYLENIDCPIFFLSPSNDFHGALHHVPIALQELQTDEVRINSAPHHNHQDTAPYEVATQLWMDQNLKGGAALPESPEMNVKLTAASGVPTVKVTADTSRPISAVDVFYTQQWKNPNGAPDTDWIINRQWHHATVYAKDGYWLAELPLLSTDEPLWVYANVTYPLEEPVVGAGYYYRVYTANEFVLSTPVEIIGVDALHTAGIQATQQPLTLIEDFKGDWTKEWFSYRNGPDGWQRSTHKLYDPLYAAPEYAKLAFSVRSVEPNTLVVGLNDSAVEVELPGGNAWQKVVLYPSDFKTIDGVFGPDWKAAKELRFIHFETLRSSQPDVANRVVGKHVWNGTDPDFKNLHWMPGTRQEYDARIPNQLLDLPVVDQKVYLDIDSAVRLTDGYKTILNTWFGGAPLIHNGVTYPRGLTTQRTR